MIKRFLLFVLAAVCLAALLLILHTYILNFYEETLRFTLWGIYLFHLVALIIICLGVELLNLWLPTQVGYAYMATVFIKIGLFVLIYKDTILTTDHLTLAERLTIVIPMFIFIALEALYSGRLMNKS